jgi:hypothetical protein
MRQVPMENINLAINEYRESPFIANLKRLCVLDKAILVTICRHTAHAGNIGMTAEDVMNRLDDLIIEFRSNPEIFFILPPMNTVFERLQVMLQRGLLEIHRDRHYGEGSLTRVSNFCLCLQVRDVKNAFLDSPFRNYLPGTIPGTMI